MLVLERGLDQRLSVRRNLLGWRSRAPRETSEKRNQVLGDPFIHRAALSYTGPHWSGEGHRWVISRHSNKPLLKVGLFPSFETSATAMRKTAAEDSTSKSRHAWASGSGYPLCP